jgi:hypothetical protein
MNPHTTKASDCVQPIHRVDLRAGISRTRASLGQLITPHVPAEVVAWPGPNGLAFASRTLAPDDSASGTGWLVVPKPCLGDVPHFDATPAWIGALARVALATLACTESRSAQVVLA